MQLYFMPFGCSLASRITLHETGRTAEFVQIDGADHRLPDGRDYYQVSPIGLVPTLRTAARGLLTDGPTNPRLRCGEGVICCKRLQAVLSIGNSSAIALATLGRWRSLSR